MIFFRAGGLLLILAIAASCLNNGQSFEEIEPNALPANITWTEHVYPVLRQRCNECHSTGPESKYGSVEGIDYSKYENAIALTSANRENKNGFAEILKAAISSSYMPPGNKDKLTPYERSLLLKWQQQGYTR
jgi:uncharacterized membrane protein